MVMTEQQRPPMKLVTYTSSTHGATPVRTHAAANGKDVARRASRRPLRIIQSPIIAPNHAPSMDSEATHEASCCVTEKADLRDKWETHIYHRSAEAPIIVHRVVQNGQLPIYIGYCPPSLPPSHPSFLPERRQTSGANVIALARGRRVLFASELPSRIRACRGRRIPKLASQERNARVSYSDELAVIGPLAPATISRI